MPSLACMKPSSDMSLNGYHGYVPARIVGIIIMHAIAAKSHWQILVSSICTDGKGHPISSHVGPTGLINAIDQSIRLIAGIRLQDTQLSCLWYKLQKSNCWRPYPLECSHMAHNKHHHKLASSHFAYKILPRIPNAYTTSRIGMDANPIACRVVWRMPTPLSPCAIRATAWGRFRCHPLMKRFLLTKPSLNMQGPVLSLGARIFMV